MHSLDAQQPLVGTHDFEPLQYLSPPAVQPHVLLLQVKSLAIVPQSPATLQQPAAPVLMNVHENCWHDADWQVAFTGVHVPAATQQPAPPPAAAECEQTLVMTLQESVVHALPSSHCDFIEQ